MHATARQEHDDGLTMTEVLVTIMLLGVVLGVVGGFFTNITRAFGFTSELASYERDARLAMDTMQREIRQAHSRDVSASLWTDAWPIQTMTGTEMVFFSLDRDDPAQLHAIRYWVEDSDRKLYRAQVEMVPAGADVWNWPATFSWDDDKRVLANDVLNTGSGADRPLFWNPDSTNSPGPECEAPDPASDTAVGMGFQSVSICLAIDRHADELPTAYQVVGTATWRNPASSNQGQEPPGANGDLYLWASITGQSATDGTRTWGAPSNCNYYGNGCIARGDKLTYRIDYGNYGASTALDHTMEVVLDPQVSYFSSTGGGSFSAVDNMVRWDLADLNGTSQAYVTLTVQVDNDAVFATNVVESATWTVTRYQTAGNVVTGSVSIDTSPGTTHKIMTPLPDLSIGVTTNASSGQYVDIDGDYTFTVTVTNSGDGPATNSVIYADKIYGSGGSATAFSSTIQCISATQGSFYGCTSPPGSAPRQWQWSVGTINPGQTVTAVITLKPASAWGAKSCDSKNFRFAVNATELGTPKKTSTHTWRYRPCLEVRKVAVTPAANSNVARGSWVTFKLQVRSRNTAATLTGVSVQDYLNQFGNAGWDLTPAAGTTCTGMNGWSCSGWSSSNKGYNVSAPGGVFAPENSYVDIAQIKVKVSSSANCTARNRARGTAANMTSQYSGYLNYNVTTCTTTTSSSTTTSGGSTTTTKATTTTTTSTTTTTTRPGGV